MFYNIVHAGLFAGDKRGRRVATNKFCRRTHWADL